VPYLGKNLSAPIGSQSIGPRDAGRDMGSRLAFTHKDLKISKCKNNFVSTAPETKNERGFPG
jgi:hypothetical protein